MRCRGATCLVGLAATLMAVPAAADDVKDKAMILCTTVRIMECFADGECVPGSPETWNIPRFTRVDFTKLTLETTAASGESRATPIERLEHEGNDVFFQGAEGGKGFTFVLDEDSGTATVAIALEGSVLAGFGYCTPMDAGQ